MVSRSNSTAVLRRNTTAGSAPDVRIKENKRTVSRVGGGAAKGAEKAKQALEEEEEEDESGRWRYMFILYREIGTLLRLEHLLWLQLW